jgi:ankyrin repeat protein
MLSNLFKLFRLVEPFNEAERTAIFKRIEVGDVHSIRSMLEKRPSLTRALDDERWGTVLQNIIERLDEDSLLELFDTSPWLAHCPDANDNMPLYFATCEGKIRLIERLLAIGASIENSGGGGTALHAAASHGHIDCIKLLLKHGAFVDSLRLDSETPLHMSLLNSQLEAIDLLIEAGADVNKERDIDGLSALGWARRRKDGELVLKLQNAGATNKYRD